VKEENAISETDTPWRHVIPTNLWFYIFCSSNFEGVESFLVSKFHRCPFWDERFGDDEKYITLPRDRTNSLNLLTHVSKT